MSTESLALDAGLETVLELVESVVGEAFGLAEQIGAATAAVFDLQPAVRRADLGGVLELVQPTLQAPAALIQGAGFVAAIDALADAQWWLEWFMLSNGVTERLIVDIDAFAIDSHVRTHFAHQFHPFLARRGCKYPGAA